MRTAEEGKTYLFIAIDQAIKFVHAELYTHATRWLMSFYAQHWGCCLIVLTENGIQFAKTPST